MSTWESGHTKESRMAEENAALRRRVYELEDALRKAIERSEMLGRHNAKLKREAAENARLVDRLLEARKA